MGVKKNQDLQVNIPIHLSSIMLRGISSDLGWKVLEGSDGTHIFKWSQGDGIFSVKVLISAVLQPLGNNKTLIQMTGEIPGIALVDGPGNIPKAFKKLLLPFEQMAINAETLLREGRMCPTCGKPLPPETGFCPNDGTTIALKCVKCGSNNIPSAQFCMGCGAKL